MDDAAAVGDLAFFALLGSCSIVSAGGALRFLDAGVVAFSGLTDTGAFCCFTGGVAVFTDAAFLTALLAATLAAMVEGELDCLCRNRC